MHALRGYQSIRNSSDLKRLLHTLFAGTNLRHAVLDVCPCLVDAGSARQQAPTSSFAPGPFLCFLPRQAVEVYITDASAGDSMNKRAVPQTKAVPATSTAHWPQLAPSLSCTATLTYRTKLLCPNWIEPNSVT